MGAPSPSQQPPVSWQGTAPAPVSGGCRLLEGEHRDRLHSEGLEPGKAVPELGEGGTRHAAGMWVGRASRRRAAASGTSSPTFCGVSGPRLSPPGLRHPPLPPLHPTPPPAGSPIPPPRGSGRGPRPPAAEGSGGARCALPARGTAGSCRRSGAVRASTRRRGVPGAAGKDCRGRREQRVRLGEPTEMGRR